MRKFFMLSMYSENSNTTILGTFLYAELSLGCFADKLCFYWPFTMPYPSFLSNFRWNLKKWKIRKDLFQHSDFFPSSSFTFYPRASFRNEHFGTYKKNKNSVWKTQHTRSLSSFCPSACIFISDEIIFIAYSKESPHTHTHFTLQQNEIVFCHLWVTHQHILWNKKKIFLGQQ